MQGDELIRPLARGRAAESLHALASLDIVDADAAADSRRPRVEGSPCTSRTPYHPPPNGRQLISINTHMTMYRHCSRSGLARGLCSHIFDTLRIPSALAALPRTPIHLSRRAPRVDDLQASCRSIHRLWCRRTHGCFPYLAQKPTPIFTRLKIPAISVL